jgi:hypothetical protein
MLKNQTMITGKAVHPEADAANHRFAKVLYFGKVF